MKKFFFIFLSVILVLVSPLAQSQQRKAVQLPDGTWFPIKEGESPQAAMMEALRLYPKSFGTYRIPEDKKLDIDWFNKCRANAVKEAKTDAAINQMILSCKHMAVPKKCRSFEIKNDRLGNEVGEERMQCIEQCSSANYYSKSIGECSKG